MGGMRRFAGFAILIVLALLVAACGARFEDTPANRGGGLAVEGGDDVPAGEDGAPAAPGETTPTGGDATTSTTVGSGGPTTSAAPTSVEPGPAPGVTATTVKVGYLLPITGAAPVPASFDKGVRAYYDEVNAKGGVNGRRIQVVVEDTQSSASVGKTKAQKLIEQDKVFTIIVLDRLENQKAIEDYLESRNFPNIEIQAPPDLAGSKYRWTFGVTIDHVVQGRLIAQYFVKVLKASKVAVVHENTPILQPGRDAFADEIKKLGADLTVSRSIDGQGNDYSSEALELSRSGATATWLYMAPTPAAKLTNQADALGYHPVWFANSISWAFDLIFTVGPKALVGARAFSPWLPLSDPRSAAYQRAYRAHNNNENPDDIGLIGWGVGQILVEGLRQAGAGLGHNSFREALQRLNFRPDVWAPLSFRPGIRQGANVIAVLKEDGRRWVLDRDFTSSF